MQNSNVSPEHLPADCFQLEELEVLRSYDHQILSEVAYYIWMHDRVDGDAELKFLFCLELIFDSNEALLLSSGENSMAIRVISASELVKIAQNVQKINGKPLIQRVAAGQLPLWKPITGTLLETIRLSRHPDAEYYANDALLLDFGAHNILIRLGLKEGLEITTY